MLLNDYQDQALKTAFYPGHIIYPSLKLAGEAGECAEKVGKWLRGDFDSDELKRQLTFELGDVLWYVSALANDLGLSLEAVAQTNLEKLDDRLSRGVLQGSGDNR